ncbi:MAG: 30S ribosomal protein S9 [Candidatus Liptonbacteria bacterium]|nr:30S ribosomal protein S9 [Candidatus Liptonbacteria bacterium]
MTKEVKALVKKPKASIKKTKALVKESKASVKELKELKYFEGVGRRKTAVSRVRIYVNSKEKTGIVVNKLSYQEYFQTERQRKKILAPLLKVEAKDKFASISIKVKGGGLEAQADAISLGIARALLKIDPSIWLKENLRQILRKEGFLTRDSRMVERKKYGLKKARRAPQWAKR